MFCRAALPRLLLSLSIRAADGLAFKPHSRAALHVASVLHSRVSPPAGNQQQLGASHHRARQTSGTRPRQAAAAEAASAAEGENQSGGEEVPMEGTMQPAAKKQRVEGGGTAGQQQQQQQQRKRKKPASPEFVARMAIHQAAKANDLTTALAAFDQAKADGVKLTADLYLSLLYLCSGGDGWEQHLSRHSGDGASGAADVDAAQPQGVAPSQLQVEAQAVPARGVEEAPAAADAVEGDAGHNGADGDAAPPPQPDAAERVRRAEALFEEMKASGGKLPMSEMCFTALARLAASRGDGDRAFQLAKEMVEQGIAPKLRSFTPALIAYAEQGDADKAFEVDAAIAEQQLDLTEAEFARLVQAAAAAQPSPAAWQRAEGVLRRVGSELTALQPDTLARVRALFAAPVAASAGASWHVAPTTISPAGQCASCGGQLQALDLSPEEMATFAEGIAAIAERQEKRPNDFQQFKAWLEKHGPFGAVIDGANVALFGQNFESGGFNFGQIQAVINHLSTRHPDLKPLLMLHVGRTKAPQAKQPAARALLQQLTDAGSFYVTPAGSNDDWYWIYASVMAGERGLLVSNDEMRDHIFQLLAPKYFLKWKQRHQARYKFSTTGLELEYPAPYTTCVQQLECGAWVFPGTDGSWLCAQQAAAAADTEAAA